jgi:hypothetical protein
MQELKQQDLGFGGYTTTSSNATEEYDGSAWTAGGNLTTARYKQLDQEHKQQV